MVLGAQGPDPLFMLGIFPLRPSSKPGPLGNTLHTRRTGAFLRALCRRAREGGDVARAYALGFLTHYALDSTVHPYVYAHSNRPDGVYSSALHMKLEKNWDTLYFQRDGHKGTPLLMSGVEATQRHWPALAALLAETINEVYPQEAVTPERMLAAFSDAKRANRLTHSPRGVKYRLARFAERLIGKPDLASSQMCPSVPDGGDITNEERVPWRSPYEPERERDESLQMLFDASVSRAARLLSVANEYFGGEVDDGALAAVIGNVGYDSGLESAD